MSAILECVEVRHTFGVGDLAEEVLRGISIAFQAGESCVLMGPSGSGKTTLLSIMGCLLTPTSGNVVVNGVRVDPKLPESLTRLRRDSIGFVFQHAQLLPFLTVIENLELVGRNAGLASQPLRRWVIELLSQLGVAGMMHKRPDQLSCGQRQRVAIARALLHRPPVLLADEPTASLDWHHGETSVRLLIEQAAADGSFLLTVTHDSRLLGLFQRRLRIDQGLLSEDTAS
jgi:putative ABC transport system ATP-binding protein